MPMPPEIRDVFDAVDTPPTPEFIESLLFRMRDELKGAAVSPSIAGSDPLVVTLAIEPPPERAQRRHVLGSRNVRAVIKAAAKGSDGRRRSAAVRPAGLRHGRRGRAASFVAAGVMAVGGLLTLVTVVSGNEPRDADTTSGPEPVHVQPGESASRGWPAPQDTAVALRAVHVGPGGAGMHGPYAIALGDEGLWLTADDDDGVWRAVQLDPATGDVLAEVPVPGERPLVRGDHGLALAGGYVWVPVLGEDRGGVLRIDAARGEPARDVGTGGLVPIEGGVAGGALTAGDGSVWTAGGGQLVRISTATGEVVATAPLDEMGDPRSLGARSTEMDFDGTTLWINTGDEDQRHLIGVDPTTLQRRSHILLPPVGDPSRSYDLVARDEQVVISQRGVGVLLVVDPSGARILKNVFARTNAIAADRDRIWATSATPGPADPVTLAAIDPATGEVLTTVAAPNGVHELVPLGDGTYWASSPGTGEVVRLRIPSR